MGRPITFNNIKTRTPPEDVLQQATSMFSAAKGYRVSSASDRMVTGTRRFIPTWAIVAAIAGLFIIFLFSLFFLLKKDEESITVSIKADATPGVTVVSIVGSGSNGVVQGLEGLVAGLESADPPAPPPASG